MYVYLIVFVLRISQLSYTPSRGVSWVEYVDIWQRFLYTESALRSQNHLHYHKMSENNHKLTQSKLNVLNNNDVILKDAKLISIVKFPGLLLVQISRPVIGPNL
jgi:hypothetical protein